MRNRVRFMFLGLFALAMAGCAGAPRNLDAVRAYYRYDFTHAREALRGDAMLRNDEQIILNTARLGIAALADGDLHEAEFALGRTFDLLSTAGLNADRTTAAILVHEGVRIWKGEPFEQALMYHYVATLYAVMGDWENARAAAANSLFRLTDFGGHQTSASLARRAVSDPSYLERGYRAVDTDFALGFLMQAIAADHSGAGGTDELLDAAVKINPQLRAIADTIRRREYDTLLIVEYGQGPAKISYGPDDALVRFQPVDYHRGPIEVRTAHRGFSGVPPAADVNRMAQDHRWNNLDDVRRAKSALGNVLLYGGAATTAVGADRRSAEIALAGVGAMALGLLTKSGAKADTRYLELAPQSIYLVPMRLGERTDLRISVPGDPAATMSLPAFEPGTVDSPRAVYVRLHSRRMNVPPWLAATQPIYGNDHTGVRPGDWPWILGGHDISTPTGEVLAAYQKGGHLLDSTLDDLLALYHAEDIIIGSGGETRPDRLRNPSFRHILEGGTGLFTPEPHSMGYQRLMFTPRPPYEPTSDLVRNAAERIRVMREEPLAASRERPTSNDLSPFKVNHPE
jgi:hypothetical protein